MVDERLIVRNLERESANVEALITEAGRRSCADILFTLLCDCPIFIMTI